MNAQELMKQNQNGNRQKNLYQIKDVKVGFIGAPFEQANNMSAIRSFAELVNRDQNLYSHAEDYQLFYVGIQDENTGEITPAVVFLENALNVKVDKPKETEASKHN